MYPQELIDKILDYLHDSPSALKACSLVSRKFYPRTRVHLFRKAGCDDPKSARIFDITRDSPELLQCIKHVQLRCLDFFLPKHHTATVDFLHSLSFPVTLSLWDDSWREDDGIAPVKYPQEEIVGWDSVLPMFLSSAPYGAIARLELTSPRWNCFEEFHDIVLSLPNVTELYIEDLTELDMADDLVVPAPSAPRIKKIYIDVDPEAYDTIAFWESLHLYRDVYLDHLEEFRVINPYADELSLVVQTANLASKNLRVMEIGFHSLPGTLRPNTTPFGLHNIADLRLGVELSDDMLPFVNWWIHSFKAAEKDSPVLEQLTIRLADADCPIGPEQLEPMKRAFEELSDFLSKLVRNVDLVFQLQNRQAQPSPLAIRFRNAIVDACGVLKEKSNLRVFDIAEHAYEVPVFPIP